MMLRKPNKPLPQGLWPIFTTPIAVHPLMTNDICSHLRQQIGADGLQFIHCFLIDLFSAGTGRWQQQSLCLGHLEIFRGRRSLIWNILERSRKVKPDSFAVVNVRRWSMS